MKLCSEDWSRVKTPDCLSYTYCTIVNEINLFTHLNIVEDLRCQHSCFVP
jgi:hypothetical protein